MASCVELIIKITKMERPEIENLKAKIAGRKLNKHQEADAYTEWRRFYNYVNELDKQFAIQRVSKSFTASEVADMLVKDFSTIEEAISYFDKIE